MDFYRRVGSRPAVRDRRRRGAADRPPDADAGHPPRRRARGGRRSTPELRSVLERFCAGVNAAAADRPLAVRVAAAAARVRALAPADMLSLGKLLAFGLSTNWERELLRADMVRELGPELAARLDPGYPAGNPVVSPRASVERRRAGARRADRRRCAARSAWRPRPAAPTTGRSPARARRPGRR